MSYTENKEPNSLTPLTSLATDDVFIVGDTSDASEVAKIITKANLITDLSTSFQPKATVLTNTTASFTTALETKLNGIEASADVTDATNVDAAGAVMNSDTSTVSMSFVIDEDNMVSDLATKVPTQQSVKAYADTKPTISSGSGAPASTPTKVGDIYIDTTGDDAYIAVGTASSADWEKSNDGAGGGVSDGDKGDITVSGSGATWTIDNGVVTLAKQADMATASVVYRKTAGTGAPEVQTLTTLKTDLGLTGTNSGDQTTIVGITGTKAQFDTAVTDGNFMYIGDAPTSHTHALSEITDSTTEALGVGSLEVGHASDTTIARVSAGVVSIEGNNIITANNNALASDINTGTSTTKFNTPDALAGSNFGIRYIVVSLNGSTALTTSDKAYFRIPAALTGMNLVSVTGTVGTGAAGSSSSGTPTFTVKNVTDNNQMLSTSLTIDASEYTSATAATAVVINTSFDDVVTDDLIEVAVTTSGTGVTYAVITLGFQLP